MVSGTAGMKAEPIWRRHAISPTWYTARLAQKPRKIPKAVHICHDMTSAPRILAGEFSAAKMGTDEPFKPMPIPISRRVMKSCSHDCETAPPMGVRRQKMALMKMVYTIVSGLTGERRAYRDN
jgi:hypothetical protein